MFNYVGLGRRWRSSEKQRL